MPRPVRAVGSFLRRNLRLPKGWPDALLQVGIWICVDSLYELVRGLTEGSHTAAFANGNRVVELERSTHTFFEVDFQRTILNDRWLIDITNFLYMNLHFVLCTVFLAWLYLRRNEVFYFVRNVFIGTMAIAIAIHAVFPTAPPAPAHAVRLRGHDLQLLRRGPGSGRDLGAREQVRGGARACTSASP